MPWPLGSLEACANPHIMGSEMAVPVPVPVPLPGWIPGKHVYAASTYYAVGKTGTYSGLCCLLAFIGVHSTSLVRAPALMVLGPSDPSHFEVQCLLTRQCRMPLDTRMSQPAKR